jgi:hypothetical protein
MSMTLPELEKLLNLPAEEEQEPVVFKLDSSENHDTSHLTFLSQGKNSVVVRFPHLDNIEKLNEVVNQAKQDGHNVFLVLRQTTDTSLDSVYKMTKLQKHYLFAIENNDYLTLPAAVYVRGFLNVYLNFFGLKRNDVVEDFMQKYSKARYLA